MPSHSRVSWSVGGIVDGNGGIEMPGWRVVVGRMEWRVAVRSLGKVMSTGRSVSFGDRGALGKKLIFKRAKSR